MPSGNRIKIHDMCNYMLAIAPTIYNCTISRYCMHYKPIVVPISLSLKISGLDP